MPGYTIGQVVQATQLTERQIRYLEEKGIVKPTRSLGGHRLFGEQDLTLLVKLAEQRRKGHSLRKAILAVNSRPENLQKSPDKTLAVRLFFGLADKERRL